MLDLIIVTFLIIVIGLIAIYSVLTGISPMPSSKQAKNALLKIIQTQSKSDFIFYELGAGWGGVTFMIAKHFPDAQIIAFERSPIPYLYLWIIKKIGKYKNVTLKRSDFRKSSFQKADFLYAYLYRRITQELGKKFEQEAKPDAFLISNSFAYDALTPTQIIDLKGFLSEELLIYKRGLLD